MPIHRSVLLALAAVLSASLAPSSSAQTPVPPQSVESAKAQLQTVVDIRNVGTALFDWLSDQVDNDKDADADPETDRACLVWERNEKGEAKECKVVDIEKLPIITHQELTRLLVPKYIAVIPEKDGWGNPFEFRLDRKHILNRSVMAIRSPGGDGTFFSHLYQSGGFWRAEAGEDLVWMDGFFVRWPERVGGIKDQR